MLGSFYYLRYPHRCNPSFLLGDRHREVWEEGIRSLVLRGARVRHPHADLVVMKEPHGSIGAPLLSGALPASRMVLLLRDPRDMVASALDGQRRNSWASESLRRRGFERATHRADTDPDGFVEGRATQLMEHVMRAQEAYDAHSGPKAFVTYERLRSDPEPSLRGIFSGLGIAVADQSIREAVEQEDWERVPPEERGEGKRLRKATPGAWRQDLTTHQVTVVERVTGPLLERHYADS